MLGLSAQARRVWNLGIEQDRFCLRYRPYRTGKRQEWPKPQSRSQQLTEARKYDDELREGVQVVQVQALRDLDKAFQDHFDNPKHFGRPTFRRKGDHEGFKFTHLNKAGRPSKLRKINHRWGEINVPKVGWVRFKLSRQWASFADTAKSARVKMDSVGRWHVSFPSPQPVVEREPTGAVIGIDRGVANTLGTSDGVFAHIPTLTTGEQERFLRLERQLARRHKGSNRYQATRRKLGRLRCRLSDRRTDFIEQTTTRLVRDHDVIVLENLQIRNMVRSAKGTIANPGRNVAAKAGLNRAIYAQRWGEFATRLKAKADTCDVLVIKVPAPNTSRTCSNLDCQHISANNRKNQAVFICEKCGHEQHADINAAINIRERGMATIQLAPARGHSGGRTQRPPGRSQVNEASTSTAA